MDDVIKQPARFDEERLRQRDAKADNTYRQFLARLCRNGQMPEDFAERAAVVVLDALEHRLTQDEARQLEAQLPLRLIKLLVGRTSAIDMPRHGTAEPFLQAVSTELGMSESEVEPIVRAVFRTLREQVSEGEADDVTAQLPADLAMLWV